MACLTFKRPAIHRFGRRHQTKETVAYAKKDGRPSHLWKIGSLAVLPSPLAPDSGGGGGVPGRRDRHPTSPPLPRRSRPTRTQGCLCLGKHLRRTNASSSAQVWTSKENAFPDQGWIPCCRKCSELRSSGRIETYLWPDEGHGPEPGAPLHRRIAYSTPQEDGFFTTAYWRKQG